MIIDTSKISSKLKAAWRFAGSLWYIKYIVVTAVGVVLVCFTGENSLMAHRRYQAQIEALQAEIQQNTEQFERDQRQLRLLQTDPKAVEQVARERYFMRRDNEDIFVLEDEL
ncbi:MAG: septum formation initiator family protein [Prevotella sp.]|nr:septum formation initiator family protein [Prevotella sp.]